MKTRRANLAEPAGAPGPATLTTADDGRALLPRRSAQLAEPAPAAPAELPADVPAPTVGEVAPFDLDALVATLSDRLTVQPAAHRLARFSSLMDVAQAAREGDQDAVTAFAIAAQITGNNPGVMQPTWLTDVRGIIERGARAITALGGFRGIGDSGLDISWPYYDGDLTALVGEQTTELTDVTSVRVDIKKATATLKTLAGGSSMSWQLLTRSDPSYQATYLRILNAAYAIIADQKFLAAVAGVDKAVSAEIVLDLVASGTTADTIRGKVFEASSRVDDATGSPATVLLAASDVFIAFGGKAGLVPNQYGTSNVSGTADAASLRVEVSGLPVLRCPSLANGVMLATNDQAVGWHGTGPLFADQDQVLQLGTDAVVWGMGVPAVYAPKGVVRFVKTATP